MAYKAKMKENDQSVKDFIESIENQRKKEDAYTLLSIFEEVSGYPAKMWGDSIIGFGRYHYEYATGHKGVAPMTGFAPGKAHRMSLYVLIPYSDQLNALLADLGKHKTGKSCLYINKLADVDLDVLRAVIKNCLDYMHEHYDE